jgi:hypothetical protein
VNIVVVVVVVVVVVQIANKMGLQKQNLKVRKEIT